jgi:four helix bundle protein
MSHAVRRFTDLRAWKACNEYKQAVYSACAEGPLSHDWTRRRQLEESVAGPPEHLAEGFGRFNPPEFARFAVIARSSLMESQNHLHDAVDELYLSDATCQDLDALAETALKEVTGLLDHLRRQAKRTSNREPRRRMRTVKREA